jgi:hypothetical protein
MFIFAGLSVICWAVLFFFQTETAGRTYDEIDELYAPRVPLRKFRGYVTKTSALEHENSVFSGKVEQAHLENSNDILEKEQV